MEEIPVRRRRRSVGWLVPLAVLGLLALVVVRARSERPGHATTTGAEMPTPAEVMIACTDDGSCEGARLCMAGTCTAITASTTVCDDITVRFPTNVSTLTPANDPDVERLARCLKANRQPNIKIASDGADDRAGEDTLAKQRAASLEAALRERGVSAERIEREP
jgi:outer membrane protein OmpA-like peptidoglycan-associated protein